MAACQSAAIRLRRSDGGRGGDDAVVGVVGGERLVDVASAEPGQCVAFPGLLLASVLVEGDRAEPSGEAVEEPAGVDRGELLRVADEHDLRPSCRGGVEEHGELAGADHGGFVDDDHRAVVELEGPVGELEGPEREGVGRDRGLGLELAPRRSRPTTAPITRCPARVQASWAASRQNVLPVPAAATSTSMLVARGRDLGDDRDLLGRELGRASSAARRMGSATMPRPASDARRRHG